MITKSTIDKIFSTIRVEEIIGEYVQLKRAGTNYKGLSPFQDEKSPSFVVSPSKQIWKDFSSGKGGTAISFLMEMEGFTYPEALKHAAKKYGIEVEEIVKNYSEQEKSLQTEKELLYKIHDLANDFYQEQLHHTENGKNIGLSYLRERELKKEIIEKFQIGYSPENKSAFTNFALEKQYSKEILEKSGLSIFPENQDSGVDRFRGRVIFPIHSFSGRVLGFGGRILNSQLKTAKYLNSPETEIYHKSHILYGLFQSKQAISIKNVCYLVEGYMDVVTLHQNEIKNVVSSSGTALSVEQIKLIKRLTDNVTILFDGDAAGIKASFRSIDMLLNEGMNIRVVLFPDGEDPDSFVRKNPREEVEKFLENQAKDFIGFKAEILLKEAKNDPTKKAEAIRDIVKSVALIDNALKQEVFLKEIANQFSISENTLFNELGIIKQKNQQKPIKQPVLSEKPKLTLVSNLTSIDPLFELEEKLIQLMLKYGDTIIKRRDKANKEYKITVIEEILAYFDEEDLELKSELNAKILREIRNGLQENEIRSGDFFVSLLDEKISDKVANALIEPYENSNWAKHNIYFATLGEKLPEEVEESILRHQREYIQTMIKELNLELKNENTSENRRVEIYKTIQKITILRNNIAKDLYRIL